MPIRKITLQRAATDKPQLGIDFIDSSFALDSSEAIQLLGFNPTLGGSFVDSAEARKLIEGDKGLVYNNATGVMSVDSTNLTELARAAIDPTSTNKGICLLYTSDAADE